MIKNIIFDIGGIIFDDSVQNISNILNEDASMLYKKVYGKSFIDCILGNNIILANCCGVAGHARIADHAILSGLTGVHQVVRIGRYAMLSGLSGLVLDLPPFCYATGTRGKLAGLNLIGLKRAGFSAETVRAIKKAYMELFLSSRTLKESIELLRSKPQVPEVMELIEFCETTERGLTTPRKKGNKAEEDDE